MTVTTKPSYVQCTGTIGSSVKAGLERPNNVASTAVSRSGTESVTRGASADTEDSA